MLTPAQLRAARALLGMDQRTLADLAGVSLPTIQRMEASDGYVRGVVDTLTKVVAALELSGIELIGENAVSARGGRGVRLREPAGSPLLRGAPARAGEAASRRRRAKAPA
ncbi:MAG: helix-turn-helix domain-containing protein [Hyphomonadaceae bacterium]